MQLEEWICLQFYKNSGTTAIPPNLAIFFAKKYYVGERIASKKVSHAANKVDRQGVDASTFYPITFDITNHDNGYIYTSTDSR